jgi:hypothetical protein
MIVEAHEGKQLMPCMRTDHPSVAISQFDPRKKIKIKRKIHIKIILKKTLPPPWGSSERAADPSLVFFSPSKENIDKITISSPSSPPTTAPNL